MGTLRGAIDQFLIHRRARRVAPTTLALYRRQLMDWDAWRTGRGLGGALADVTIDELRGYLAYLADERPSRYDGTPGLRPRSVHSVYRTLRALWNFLTHEEDGAGQPALSPAQTRFFANGRIALPAIPRTERPAIGPGSIQALLAAAGDGRDEESARNRAILLLLAESGMRVHELCDLRDSSVSLKDRRARIVGKGGKPAVVFWGPGAQTALARYLRYRRGLAGGEVPLLRGCSSRNNGGAITPNLVREMIKTLAEKAGVELPKGAPVHGLRHGFARDLRRRGATIEEVQEQLRHEDRATTLIYLGLDEEARRATHRKFYGDGTPESGDGKKERRTL